MRLFLTTWALFCSVMAADPAAKFKEHEVVPDVLPTLPADLAALEVNYSNGLKLDFGNELTPTQVKNKPTDISWKADSEALYTLVMTDPDAPSRANPVRREFKHWVVVNIPGSDVNKGHELAGYVGSGPPQGTGLHRYIFLVYKQSSKLPETPTVPSTSTSGRPNFRVAKFAEENGLGSPIAGNLYQAQYDDYVPILHASFTQ